MKPVEYEAVHLVQVGPSKKNFILSFSKKALIAMKEGKSFPVKMELEDDKIVNIVAMRDSTYQSKLKVFSDINDKAAADAKAIVEQSETIDNISKSIAESADKTIDG